MKAWGFKTPGAFLIVSIQCWVTGRLNRHWRAIFAKDMLTDILALGRGRFVSLEIIGSFGLELVGKLGDKGGVTHHRGEDEFVLTFGVVLGRDNADELAGVILGVAEDWSATFRVTEILSGTAETDGKFTVENGNVVAILGMRRQPRLLDGGFLLAAFAIQVRL